MCRHLYVLCECWAALPVIVQVPQVLPYGSLCVELRPRIGCLAYNIIFTVSLLKHFQASDEATRLATRSAKT